MSHFSIQTIASVSVNSDNELQRNPTHPQVMSLEKSECRTSFLEKLLMTHKHVRVVILFIYFFYL